MFAVHEALTWAVPRVPWLTLAVSAVLLVGLALAIDPQSRTKQAGRSALVRAVPLAVILLLAFLYDAWSGR